MSKTRQAEERRILKAYLSRHFHAREKLTILRERLRWVHTELSAAEVESCLQQQSATAENCMTEIMNLLALLPVESTERTILELRHIDSKSWWEIQRTVHLSRSPCFSYYSKGLDQLLSIPEVRRRLELNN